MIGRTLPVLPAVTTHVCAHRALARNLLDSYMHLRAGVCGRYFHTARYLGPLASSRALQKVSPISFTLQHFAASRRILSVAALPQSATAVSPAVLSAEAVTAMQAVALQAHSAPPAAPHAGRQLLSVAPMMDWTDTHYRQLARIISRRTWLWTEMVSVPGVDRNSLFVTKVMARPWWSQAARPDHLARRVSCRLHFSPSPPYILTYPPPSPLQVVDKTILHTPYLERFLWFPPEQHPIVCQV